MPKPPPPPTSDFLTAREKPTIVPRLVLTAVEGFGKTTTAAYAPRPVMLMAENGYDTLLSKDKVPAIPAISIPDWPALLDHLNALLQHLDGFDTIVLDAISGFERMLHQHGTDRDFSGDRGERGFLGYMRGYEVAAMDWVGMLARLDILSTRHNKNVILLGHMSIKGFRNPTGADFDRYTCACHQKTWEPTRQWADAVLFGNFLTIMADESQAARSGRGKAIGGTDRVIYTERRDTHDAKNRYGMPPEIWLSDQPDENWKSVWDAITN